MRKRVKYIVKDKRITVKQNPYNRAQNLSKWVWSRQIEDNLLFVAHSFKFISRPSENRFRVKAKILKKSPNNTKLLPFQKIYCFDAIDDSFPSLYFDRID